MRAMQDGKNNHRDERNRDTITTPDENREMFDDIAAEYDTMNSLISLGLDWRWRAKAVDCLEVFQGGRYLDIGTGTADLCLAIAARAGDTEIIGIDPSEQMLAVGEQKVNRAGLTHRISLRPGDATALEFNDRVFDGIITGFCIRNVARRQRALEEMHRVLKTGAKTVILELTTPGSKVMVAGQRLPSRDRSRHWRHDSRSLGGPLGAHNLRGLVAEWLGHCQWQWLGRWSDPALGYRLRRARRRTGRAHVLDI